MQGKDISCDLDEHVHSLFMRMHTITLKLKY